MSDDGRPTTARKATPLFVPDAIEFSQEALYVTGHSVPVRVLDTERPKARGTLYLEDGIQLTMSVPLTDEEWNTIKKVVMGLRDRALEQVRTAGQGES